jgi:TolB-like protein/DNA-binding winged helix-turn-helix (wHTH) protein/Tfp pilus assembly protein PilF
MPRYFHFDEFTVDASRGGIWNQTTFVPLRPKTLALLLYLAANPSRLVTKDEIAEAVWPGLIATDESIAKCVSELRAALGDARHDLLRTAPKRGYIFNSTIVPSDERVALSMPAPAALAAAWLGKNLGVRVAMIAALVFLIALVQFPNASFSSKHTEPPSIAVLPFSQSGTNALEGYLGDGLAEDLSVGLGKFSELFVIAHGSSARYGEGDSPQTVGRELGANYLVRGSIRRIGDRLRLTAELVEVPKNRQVWAQQYDIAGPDLFTAQDELADKIVATLAAHVSRSELHRVSQKGPANLDAYDLYLEGRAILRARSGPRRNEMVLTARGLFEQALKLDPSYAPTLDGLAHTYAVGFRERTDYDPLVDELGRTEALKRALSLVRHSLELDPYRAGTHVTAAWILHWLYHRDEALKEIERALELNPNLADGRFTHMLVHAGRPDEAIAFMQRALKHDPFPPPIYRSYLGNAYYETGQYELASRTLRGGLDAIPNYRPLNVWLAASLGQLGLADEARPLVLQVLKGTPDFSIQKWLDHIQFAKRDDAERLATGMKIAGFPD